MWRRPRRRDRSGSWRLTIRSCTGYGMPLAGCDVARRGRARFWLLAGAQRAAGSHADAYEVFVALHEAGHLLPTDDDRLRDVFERDARVLAAARAEAPPALEAAAVAPDSDVSIRFGELVDARLLLSAAGDEVWVAIATRATDRGFVADGFATLFAIVFDAAGAEIWEARPDWPSGPLEWFEVARLGLREPISPARRRRDARRLPPSRRRRTRSWRPCRQSAWRARSIRAANSSRCRSTYSSTAFSTISDCWSAVMEAA